METIQSLDKKTSKLNLDFKDSKYATGRRKTSIAKIRLKKGVPLDAETLKSFRELSKKFKVNLKFLN